MSRAASVSPRSGGSSPTSQPYSLTVPDGENTFASPVVPASFASQVEQAMALGHDVEMSVTIEQVESVPVPDTPVAASEPATPVQLHHITSFASSVVPVVLL